MRAPVDPRNRGFNFATSHCLAGGIPSRSNLNVLSQASPILGHTLDADVNPEQISREFVRFWMAFGLGFFGASNEQLGPGKHWAGDITCWQVDDASDDTIGRYPNNLGTAVAGVPDVALDVHGMSVGVYALFVQVEEQSLVGDCARLSIVIERVHVLHGRVGQKHGVVTGVPCDAIGDRHLLVHCMQRAVMIKSEEHTFVREFADLGVDKRLDPKPALGVDGTVVRSQSVALV